MQYTGESFSEGLQSIATSLTQNSGEGPRWSRARSSPMPTASTSATATASDASSRRGGSSLLRVINQRMMRLRTGKINHYVLFALAFLALVFLLSICNVI